VLAESGDTPMKVSEISQITGVNAEVLGKALETMLVVIH
jgi:hypothetical protein